MEVAINNIDQLVGLYNSIFIMTEVMFPSQYSYIYKCFKHLMIPESGKWNFRALSLLLNENDDFKVDFKRSCRLQQNKRGEFYYFFIFYNEKEKKFILIRINKDSKKIEIKAIILWLDSWQNVKQEDEDDIRIQKRLTISIDKP